MQAKVGLVLGSGAARGIAHIGVLKVLERERVPVDYVAGCSIGSVIGALYCSGQSPDDIIKFAKHVKPKHWLDFVIPKMGILSGDRILEIMKILTRRKHFHDLKIPLAIVATDINEGREFVFTEGDLATAVRASISIPGIFVPYRVQERLFVDGAVLNPTPIDVARNMGADIVIAVDLAHAGIVDNITNVLDVIVQSIDLMERELFKYRQCKYDILIQPDIGHIPPGSFECIDECVRLGEEAAEKAVPEIRRLLSAGEKNLIL